VEQLEWVDNCDALAKLLVSVDDFEELEELLAYVAEELEKLEDKQLKLEDVDRELADDIEEGTDEGIDTREDDGEDAKQVAPIEIWFELSVIDATRANTLPVIEDSAFIVTGTAARSCQTEVDPNPRVALVPTFQITLPGVPPLVISTLEPILVVILLPIWKHYASLLLPIPTRVKIRLNCADEGNR
jgi:hypothetical protein